MGDPLDGLSKAMETEPFWTAVMVALGSVLTTVGARGAGQRVKRWATSRNGNGGDVRVVTLLANIETAIREENAATRKAIYQQAEKHREALQPIGEGIQRLLGRGDRKT